VASLLVPVFGADVILHTLKDLRVLRATVSYSILANKHPLARQRFEPFPDSALQNSFDLADVLDSDTVLENFALARSNELEQVPSEHLLIARSVQQVHKLATERIWKLYQHMGLIDRPFPAFQLKSSQPADRRAFTDPVSYLGRRNLEFYEPDSVSTGQCVCEDFRFVSQFARGPRASGGEERFERNGNGPLGNQKIQCGADKGMRRLHF
jgi:hypothetical protein